VKQALRWMDMAVYLAFVVYAVLFGSRGSAWYAGLGLCVVCTPLWCIAKWQLAEAFSVRADARRLVTQGLYSRLRHPIYIFGGLAVLGVLLALLGWGALVIGVIVALVEVGRARREDHVLAEAFGAEYAAYRSRTWF
jgi:protein-S-isoprenylcysteine O-methyltransferase Ste14